MIENDHVKFMQRCLELASKKVVLTVYLVVYSCLAYAQRIDIQHTFIATTEEEVYKLYDQIADSVRLSNKFAVHDFSSFAITPFFEFFELESKDTLMKFGYFNLIMIIRIYT